MGLSDVLAKKKGPRDQTLCMRFAFELFGTYNVR
jgi:hypothetical protein